MAAPTKQKVLDTHIHLAVDWRPGEGGLENKWLPGEPPSFHNPRWTEEAVLAENDKVGGTFEIEGFVFVECFNVPFVEEARWVIKMARSAESKVLGVVAHIPVPEGAAAVNAFLDELREDGKLPKELKGGRVVLLGNPMPPPDVCLADAYTEGLAALADAGLLWEWCCKPESLPAVAKASAKFPGMTFVLDHLGHNAGGNDFDTWAPAITELAKCSNVVAKLGAIEQWGVTDPAPYLDHALKAFGPDRVLAESNWFVNTASGDAYDVTFKRVLDACGRAGFTQAQIDAVFVGNARRVYSL